MPFSPAPRKLFFTFFVKRLTRWNVLIFATPANTPKPAFQPVSPPNFSHFPPRRPTPK